jgi:hypothetical protein
MVYSNGMWNSARYHIYSCSRACVVLYKALCRCPYGIYSDEIDMKRRTSELTHTWQRAASQDAMQRDGCDRMRSKITTVQRGHDAQKECARYKPSVQDGLCGILIHSNLVEGRHKLMSSADRFALSRREIWVPSVQIADARRLSVCLHIRACTWVCSLRLAPFLPN